jgi:hypothetical protein
MVRLTMRRAGQYSERPYWELQPRAAPEPKPEAPRKAQPEEAGPGFSPPRLRLVVPGR